MADFVGMMERSMKEILLIIIFRGKASISDQTERAIRKLEGQFSPWQRLEICWKVFKGEFRWPDGRKYLGEFRNNMRDGFGVMVFQDGKIIKGNWMNDKLNGKGIVIENGI